MPRFVQEHAILCVEHALIFIPGSCEAIVADSTRSCCTHHRLCSLRRRNQFNPVCSALRHCSSSNSILLSPAAQANFLHVGVSPATRRMLLREPERRWGQISPSLSQLSVVLLPTSALSFPQQLQRLRSLGDAAPQQRRWQRHGCQRLLG